MLEKLKNFPWGYVIITTLLISVGICFAAFNNALTVLSITVGAIIAITGIALGIHTLIRTERGVLFALRITLFSLMLISGITTMLVPDTAIVVLSNILCLLTIIDGAFKLHMAIDTKSFRNPLWWILTVLSVILIAAAFLMTKTALDNSTLSMLLGIIIITDGTNNIISLFVKPASTPTTACDPAPAVTLPEENTETTE